jgi:hypothetical protein
MSYIRVVKTCEGDKIVFSTSDVGSLLIRNAIRTYKGTECGWGGYYIHIIRTVANLAHVFVIAIIILRRVRNKSSLLHTHNVMQIAWQCTNIPPGVSNTNLCSTLIFLLPKFLGSLLSAQKREVNNLCLLLRSFCKMYKIEA